MKEKIQEEIFEKKENIIPINIEEELKSSYIDYSMSVIISRALPDIRDGLKPVHRRILYSMYKIGLFSNKQYKKSARIVGEVLGKYHPHGDNSVYDSIVRMAQNWSMRYPLIDGQGNFGSIDNDSPAAMRYTEIRLKNISEEILLDIEKNTVEMKLNFDNSLLEPIILPTKIPNLLINGSSGIAVGMATNIAPHNLKESIDAICAYIDNNSISIDELMSYIKGPDFPTGGIIYGNKEIIKSFYSGKGKIIIRSKIHQEKINNKKCIVVDELPYQVNKEELIYNTKNLIKEKKIEGITDIKDESGRQGLRIVYILKKETIYKVVLNNLYKYTKLQTSFNINNIALVNGIPTKLNLKEIIYNFVNFRHNIIIKRTKYELEKLNKKIHILYGIRISLSQIDLVIKLIRKSNNFKNACNDLINKLKITNIQAKSILEIKLHKLTSLEIKKIEKEFKYSKEKIKKLENILKNENIRMDIIKKELIEIKERYGDERKTKIEYINYDLEEEDFIENKQVVLTISNIGYIKRTDLSEYKIQMRGGVGKKGVIIREEDYIEKILVAETHQYIIFFTEKGKCFWLKVFYIPIGSKKSKGRSIQNLININENDKIKTYVLLKNIKDINYINNHFIVFITKKGKIKRTLLKEYSKPRKNGIKAIIIKKNDVLLDAIITNGKKQIIIGTNKGKALRILESSIKLTKRNSYGIKSISLKKEDFVIGIICIKNENIENILVVSENGYGKKTSIKHYRITNRNRIGVQTIKINDKTGNLLYIKNVTNDQDLIIIKKSGIVIRIPINNICLIGRSTQGVKLLTLKKDEKIASITTTLK